MYVCLCLSSLTQLNLSVLQHEIAEIAPKVATHSKTYNDNEELWGAAHAIDKDLSTQALTVPDNKGVIWIKLEFDKTYFIHKVVIYNKFYTDWYYADRFWCARSVANFRACIDKENKVDVSVYQGEVEQKSCGTLQLTNGLEQSDQIYTLLCNTEGDTVKLSKTTGRIAVLELAITGKGEFIPACRYQLQASNIFNLHLSQSLRNVYCIAKSTE